MIALKWLSGLFLLCCTLISAEEKVVKLTPPIISPKTIALEYSCMRPGREGGINISIEKRSDKTIINCYGHGGAGWTTLFGSVQKTIDLFENENPNKDIPIRVLGSGCVGLTTAIELSRLGYNVAGIYTKNLYDMASWRAAGFFGLLAIDDPKAIVPMAVKTFLTYQQIEKGQHPYIPKGAVELLPIYCTSDTENELAFLVEQNLVPPKESVSLEFDHGIKHKGFFKYLTYYMNTGILMKQLINEVKKLNIPLEVKEIHSYCEVSENMIFNCTGLGAEELNMDSKLNAIAGHLIALNEESGQGHMDYMLLTNVVQNGKKEALYMTPKCIIVTPDNPMGRNIFGVLGVTFIPHAEKLSSEQLRELDRIEFNKILDRASIFFSGHSYNK